MLAEPCAVCARPPGQPDEHVRNSHDDWLCLPCNEWLFLYLLDPDLRRPWEEPISALVGERQYEPWELPGYVPEGAEPMGPTPNSR